MAASYKLSEVVSTVDFISNLHTFFHRWISIYLSETIEVKNNDMTKC